MTDWKGNEIKEGDTIAIYCYQTSEVTLTFGFLNFENNSFEKTGEINEPSKFIWKKVFSSPVIAQYDRLYYLFKASGGQNHITFIDIEMLALEQGHGRAVCIEGKSDNEAEFFKDYFKV